MTFFDQALEIAVAEAERLAGNVDVVVVRDVLGRCRLIADDRRHDLENGAVEDSGRDLQARLGHYATEPLVLRASDIPGLDLDALLLADRVIRIPRENGHGEVSVLERTIVGSDWWTVTERTKVDELPHYVVLYSLKGGLGRSTAASFLARGLAEEGQSVLLVDLDLESPGLSSLVLPTESLPDFGVIDVLVEAAVGNNVAELAIARSASLQPNGGGQVWVAPAAGRPRPHYHYLPKLDRAYLTVPGSEINDAATPFAMRLAEVLENLVEAVTKVAETPACVIIDCRAGIQDIAGVALTHLADLGLLFAADTEQTWWGYRTMFQQWSERPDQARRIRERLKMVAALVDKSSPDTYLAAFRDHAVDVFSVLYDVAAPDDLDAFNPSVSDSAAPHSPLPIFFDEQLRHAGLSVIESAITSAPLRAAFDGFIRGVSSLTLGAP